MRIFAIAVSLAVLMSSSSGARSEISFDSFYNQLKAGMTAACKGRDDCLRMAGSFGWFVWNNRDKYDVQYNTVKCLGISAVKRGYIWAPLSIWETLSPEDAKELGIEVCDCVIGYWGREPICRKALLEGDTKLLTDILAP